MTKKDLLLEIFKTKTSNPAETKASFQLQKDATPSNFEKALCKTCLERLFERKKAR